MPSTTSLERVLLNFSVLMFVWWRAFIKVKGAHVLVRRGRCSFFAKALAVSNSGGASAVVVDEGAGRLRMEAEEGQTVGIPVVMVSKLDGKLSATCRTLR